MTALPMIEVIDLGRRFGDLVAVAGLRFTVGRGELFGLVGPDGAGKTTTLRMLAGVLRPTEGDALVAGASVADAPEEVKHSIAYMSQRFGLYEDLTVMENLVFYADLYRVPRRDRKARLDRLFSFSNLGPFRSRLAGNLSGGMKQKLGLSCALIHQPEVLLLDEPTFGVDPVSRRELWLIVHEMIAEGVTAVVSTAYLDEAERFDRVALLDGGGVLALDTPTVLQASLEGRIVELAAGDLRQAQAVARRLPGVVGAAVFGHYLHLTLEAPADATARARLREELTEAGVAGPQITPIAPGLEDVFIQRVRASQAAPGGTA